MSLVRISLLEGKPATYHRAIADSVHRAMVETIDVPALDRFQVITEHTSGSLIYDPTSLDIGRSDDVVVIQIILNVCRSAEQKRALYARVLELLAKSVGLRPQDVLISLTEVSPVNRTLGNGQAQEVS